MESISQPSSLPRHVAIIMDGNGRWARQRKLPRITGHKAGVKTLRVIVEKAAKLGIEILTVYAFSSENWKRPGEEVSLLLELFMNALKSEVKDLDKNNVKLRFIGDRSRFPAKLQASIDKSEQQTAANTGLVLNVAANYGGRWDITQACRTLVEKQANGQIQDINEEVLATELALSQFPEPELFIRSGGEHRISNYLLWQLAYTELYFTDTLWPDFDEQAFVTALAWYSKRERRFGQTSEQIKDA